MAVKGKKITEWTHQVYCDFGELKRRTVLANSFSAHTAINRWKRLKNLYSQNYLSKDTQRVWVEERHTRLVIADSFDS